MWAWELKVLFVFCLCVCLRRHGSKMLSWRRLFLLFTCLWSEFVIATASQACNIMWSRCNMVSACAGCQVSYQGHVCRKCLRVRTFGLLDDDCIEEAFPSDCCHNVFGQFSQLGPEKLSHPLSVLRQLLLLKHLHIRQRMHYEYFDFTFSVHCLSHLRLIRFNRFKVKKRSCDELLKRR